MQPGRVYFSGLVIASWMGYLTWRNLNFLKPKDKLEEVSNIFQIQLTHLQENYGDCSKPNLLCGHFSICGFGCQIHHRAACVMMSYALQLPLIQDLSGWQYGVPWENVFQPLGIPCDPGNNTLHWDWRSWNRETNEEGNASDYKKLKKFALENGIVVPTDLAEIVELELGPNDTFLWWVGQFIKFTMRFNETYENTKLKDLRKEMNMFRPYLGSHVRRTDKISEYKRSVHEISEYFVNGQANFMLKSKSNQKRDWRKMFLSSDDPEMLNESKILFPNWNIKTFETSNTSVAQQRMNENSLNEIVRDVMALSLADVVICGMTSNICRLLLEMRTSGGITKETLFYLDGRYSYRLFNAKIPMVVIKK